MTTDISRSVSEMERRLAVLGYVVVSDERYEAIRSVTRRLLDSWQPDMQERSWWIFDNFSPPRAPDIEPMTEAEWQWLQQGDFV
jgi:hypothetical protein